MPRKPAEIWQARGWRKGVAVVGAAYCVVAWVLPIVVHSIFRGLPLLQEHAFTERLAISAMGTGVLVASMLVAFPGRVRIYRRGTPWETTTAAAWALVGLGMFTVAAAAWSADTLGTFAKLLPGSAYSAVFTVTGVERSGSRRRSVAVDLRAAGEKRDVELVLSRFLFEVPELSRGDVIVASGKRTLAGTYIERISVRGR